MTTVKPKLISELLKPKRQNVSPELVAAFSLSHAKLFLPAAVCISSVTLRYKTK